MVHLVGPYRWSEHISGCKFDSRLRHFREGKPVEVSLSFPSPLSKTGCQTHFHQGPHQPCGCLQTAECKFRMYKCNYSLTVKRALGAVARQKQGARLGKTRWRPDSACGPCVCHLCSKSNEKMSSGKDKKLNHN